jgi:hypothetical protein
MEQWFIAKKAYEKKIKNNITKSINNKERETNIDIEITLELEKPYYKLVLDKCEKLGKDFYGLKDGLHYGKKLSARMLDNDIQEFWKAFNDEVERIKDNDIYACRIYHYNQDEGRQILFTLDILGDMVKGIN